MSDGAKVVARIEGSSKGTTMTNEVRKTSVQRRQRLEWEKQVYKYDNDLGKIVEHNENNGTKE